MIYPNIEAIASGTISGEFRDWVKVKPEAKALLAELLKLREENARLTRERDEARAQKEKRNEEA